MKKAFILGNPRSGTSLLRLMLNAHPNIISPPESGFLHWWRKKYENWEWGNASNETINNFIKDFSSSKKIETWNLDYNKLKEYLLQEKPNSYGELGEVIYKFYGKLKPNVQLIIDKNNYYINHLEELISIWPDALYIHLIRDGRDVSCSYIDLNKLESNSPYKPKLSKDISEIAKEWSRNNENIYSFIQQNNLKGICVRYEDLVSSSKDTLEDLCKDLGLPYNAQMLSYYESSKHDEPIETMDWKTKTLTPPDKLNIGRYKLMLNEQEISEFNKCAGDTLKKYNYL